MYYLEEKINADREVRCGDTCNAAILYHFLYLFTFFIPSCCPDDDRHFCFYSNAYIRHNSIRLCEVNYDVSGLLFERFRREQLKAAIFVINARNLMPAGASNELHLAP